jgi:hypothetical protein
MTDISLLHSARPIRRGRMTTAAAVALRRNAIALERSREELDGMRVGGLASARRELTGFVDFLLGRGARHSW